MGAEEGIYTLNLTELHENAMDLLYPRRTTWMFVIKDVLMTLSGKRELLVFQNFFKNCQNPSLSQFWNHDSDQNTTHNKHI